MCGYVKPRVAHGADVGEGSNGDTMMAHLIPHQALIERAALPQGCSNASPKEQARNDGILPATDAQILETGGVPLQGT
jgi:hypothetical protein